MDTGSIAATAVEHLKTYGSPVLAIALLLSGLGVPLPASLLVIAAGALISHGRLSLPVAFVHALFGAIVGSVGSYQTGRYGLDRVLNRLKKGKTWHKAEESFKARADLAIFLSRFLLTPLALPTNLIAGGERFPLGRFTVICGFGNALYLLFYGGLGYVFGSRWKWAAAQAQGIGMWIALGAVLLFGVFQLYRWRRGQTETPEPSRSVG